MPIISVLIKFTAAAFSRYGLNVDHALVGARPLLKVIGAAVRR